MATNIEKHIWLVDILRRHDGLTFKELNALWMENTELNPFGKPMTKRTLHRHQNEIMEIYGFAIKCNLSNYKYYVDHTYKEKEDDVSSWLLQTLSIDNMIRENRSLNQRILLESHPTGENCLPIILLSMKESTQLEITYCRFEGDQAYTATISPYFVKVFGQRWYVIGLTSRHPGELRTYALDRISQAKRTGIKFSYPSNFSPADYFCNSFGIYHSDKPAERIEIKVYGNQRKYLRSLPLHISQIEKETNDNFSIFSMELCIDEDFVREIMKNGSAFEILEPASLREEIAKRMKETLRLYENSWFIRKRH